MGKKREVILVTHAMQDVKEALADMAKPKLMRLAKAYQVSVRGSKAAIAERLVNIPIPVTFHIPVP